MLTTNSDIFIEFICKVLTFVFHNKSKFKTQQESQTSSLRLITQENRNIREEVISIFTKNLAYIELVVEVLENIEGCSSNLIELWRFILTTNKKPKNHNTSFIEIELSTSLRSLMAGSLLLPSYKKPKEILNIRFRNHSEIINTWNPDLKDEDILRFPKQGLSLELENRVLAIYVDYTLKEIKPELKLQHFNGRSRVMSFDISDSKSLMKTENSSETTPPRRRIMSVISSLGIHEDSESGIKLIASIYDSNSESESSESNAFQNNSFEMNFGSNHLEEDNDSIVALYLKKCEKLSKNSLFVGTNSVLIETNNLVKYWKQKFI